MVDGDIIFLIDVLTPSCPCAVWVESMNVLFAIMFYYYDLGREYVGIRFAAAMSTGGFVVIPSARNIGTPFSGLHNRNIGLVYNIKLYCVITTAIIIIVVIIIDRGHGNNCYRHCCLLRD